MRCRLAAVLVLVGCARGGPPDVIGEHPDGNTITHPDATGQHVDAYVNLIDAPPGQMTKTLSQTTGNVTGNTSLACAPSPYATSANNFYRVFDPAMAGISTDFHVTIVTFQVEDCESFAGNGQVVTVRVGTYNGTPGTTLTAANMTVLASNNNVQVPEVDEVNGVTPGGLVNAPVNATIQAGKKLFIEVDAPAGIFGDYFYIGANTAAETAPGYVSAPDCNPPGTTPTSASSIAMSQVSLLMTVTGTY